MDLTDRTWDLFIDCYELRKALPTPMDTGDAMNTMVPLTFNLATQEAHDFYKELYAELREKVAQGRCGRKRKYRLVWGAGLPLVRAERFPVLQRQGRGLPCGNNLPQRREGGASRNSRKPAIRSNTSRGAGSGCGRGGTTRRAAAQARSRRWNESSSTWKTTAATASCSTPPSPAAAGTRNRAAAQVLNKVYGDVPHPHHGDIVDISSYNEVDTHNRIDAFIDALAARKARG